MNAKRVFALSALVLATGAALADPAADAPLTRAEVAQAAGQGELAAQSPPGAAPASDVSRVRVEAAVLTARAEHELLHGQASAAPNEAPAETAAPIASRARVKVQVLQARAGHELLHGQIEPPLVAAIYRVAGSRQPRAEGGAS